MMPPTTGRAVLRLAEIARRRHHHHPRVDRALRRLAQRIVAIRLEHRMPERQVDDADVDTAAVLDRPVDRVDDVARVARCRPRRAPAG